MANISNPAEFHRQVFAQDGFRVVTSAFSQPAGEAYVAVYALDAVTGMVLIANTGDSLSSDLAAGTVLYGDFSAVAVSTGTLIAYIK